MGLFNILSGTCNEDLLKIVSFLKHGVLPLIQIGIPIILIIMGSIDLGKAVLSSDDKEIKGAVGKLVKRAIAAIAVFFVATIVSLVMGMFGRSDNTRNMDNPEGSANWADCWDQA